MTIENKKKCKNLDLNSVFSASFECHIMHRCSSEITCNTTIIYRHRLSDKHVNYHSLYETSVNQGFWALYEHSVCVFQLKTTKKWRDSQCEKKGLVAKMVKKKNSKLNGKHITDSRFISNPSFKFRKAASGPKPMKGAVMKAS